MDFIKLSPDQVLEVEFVVLPLMRCRPGLGGKGPVVLLIVCCLLMSSTLCYLEQQCALQRIHQTLQTRAEFIYIRHSGTLLGAAFVHQRMRTSFVFEKASNIHRNNQWSNLSSIAYGAGMPFLLAE